MFNKFKQPTQISDAFKLPVRYFYKRDHIKASIFRSFCIFMQISN
jgi:hypothetical protein